MPWMLPWLVIPMQNWSPSLGQKGYEATQRSRQLASIRKLTMPRASDSCGRKMPSARVETSDEC
jgi:hypothetical protein